MVRRGYATVQGRFFSLTIVVLLVSSSLLIGMSMQMPNAAAGAPKNHTVGNVEINILTDWGRILDPIKWKGDNKIQTIKDPAGLGFIGLVIDHDDYVHTPGAEDIADSFKTGPYYSSQDDLQVVNDITMIIDDGITQKSFASFQNKGAGFPDDILINQTAWTVLNKDWAIIQWSLLNLKGVSLTNVSIGLEIPLSVVGGSGGVGGDSGDDIDGFDATNDTYWAQDDDTKTTIGFASAIITEPITHYYSEDYGNIYTWDEYKMLYEDETWLYERLTAPNATVGTTPGNRTTTVGWDNFPIGVGSVKTFTLVIAVNDSFDNMNAAVQDAQFYYDYVAAGFRITEFCDEDSVIQRIEVFNNGKGATDLYAEGYRLSVDDGATFLTGDNWDKKPLLTYEYGVFTLSSGSIPSEGGTIGLYRDLGGGNVILIDELSYGQKGLAPDPLVGESVARRYDDSMVGYSNDWLRNASSSSTWGRKNDVGTIKSPNVVINRVGFYPWNPVEAYVELMWTGGVNDISGYKIVIDEAFVVPPGTILGATNRFFVLNQTMFPQFFTNMSGSADNVYLYDANDNLLDMVGWSSAHDQGTFMSRIPDGNGNYTGFNDTTSMVAGWIFNIQPSLQITEFYADTTSSTIEIHNPRGGDIAPDPTRWSLDVNSGPLTGTWSPTTIPANGNYSTFTMDVAGGNPGQEGDTIGLYYDPGSGWILIDQVGYGTNGVAPDPLFGESTARYWDNAIPGYSDDWTRNASTGPTWNAQNDVLAINPTPSIILNEVMFNPTSPDGKFIAIINNAMFGINISNYYVVCDDVYQLPISTWLWHSDVLIIQYKDAPALFQNLSSGGDNVYLYDDIGQLLDMVGWNNPHKQGMSVCRVPEGFGTYQSYNDTTSEAAGWVFDSPLQVLMTEISDNESSVAQIEVYNPWYSSIDFTVGFTFNSTSFGGELSGVWSIPIADSGEYALFNVSSPDSLDNDGDTISLYQNGILIEELSYGHRGTVPDPLNNESVERYWNWTSSAYTDVWERNFTTGPNFGLQNDIPEANLSSSIMLNEVLFYPNAPEDAFLEVFNRDGAFVNISGYKIVCDTEYIVPDGTELNLGNDFFYLLNDTYPVFFLNMSSTGDNVYLYDANGSLVDMVGWNSQHIIGRTICRIPDGNGTRDGYDDVSSIAAGWRFNQIPSINLILISPDREKGGYRGQNTTYGLRIMNNQDNDDVVDISNVSGPWGWEVIILDENGTLLNDSNGNGLPDIFVSAGGIVTIIVVVIVPIDAPLGENETTIITVQSTFNPMFTDNATLITTVRFSPPPFQTVTFPTDSYVIPFDDKQNDVLKAFGFVHALLRNGSYIYRIIEPPNATIYTTMFPLGEVFAGGPMLVMPYDGAIVNAVISDFPSVTLDITISSFTSDRVNIIVKPTNILIIYGVYGHTQDVLTNMDIPYTMVTTADVGNDPDMLFDYDLIVDDCPGWSGSVPAAVANNMQLLAESGGEIIFTDIALRDLDAVFPGHIPITSNVGGTWPCSVYTIPEFPGQYYGPPVLDIFTMNSGQIMMAPTDPEVRIMVDSDNYNGNYRVLAAYFYVGSSIDELGVVEGFGFHPGDQPPDASILASIFFGNKFVHIPPSSELPDALPPELYINVVGEDIILNWTPPRVPGVSNYLIYRSTSQTGFNFSDIWVDTSLHDDNGIIPLRITWNDTGAASDTASQEYYYTIRTVLDSGKISSTSRTVGKWTKTFPQGESTFSLPLDPIDTYYTDYYTTTMNADYIKYMDPIMHTWVQHNLGDDNTNNVEMKLGEGFEVKFSSQTTYTFTGMPGAMIMYDDDTGFLGFDHTAEAKSLLVTVEVNGDVNLTWQEPGIIAVGNWYDVYYSNKRDGFFGTLDVDYFLVSRVDFGTNTATHVNAQANSPGTRLYYMVVPFNATGVRGSSTYSIGIWTEEFLSQYDTFGIPLKLNYSQTADWYCDNIPDTVGMNYYNVSAQRWSWHSTRMPAGAFDPQLLMTEGYQISTSNSTKYTFVGI